MVVLPVPSRLTRLTMGGKESNKHDSKKLRAGRGTVGKAPVVGAKDRETKAGQDAGGGERQ